MTWSALHGVSTRPTWTIAAALCGIASTVVGADDAPTPAAPAIRHVVLIGGFDSDPTPQQLAGTAPRGAGNSGMYQLRNDLRARRVSAEYFNWNGTPPGSIAAENPPGASAIVDHLRTRRSQLEDGELAIVGNSWGGHTAWEVCTAAQRLDPPLELRMAIFLDPSSVGRPNSQRPAQLPANVRGAVQYASRSAIVWTPWKDEPRVVHIDLASPKHGFLRAGGPPYAAAFSPGSHVGAEWDDLIHADIIRRLVEPVAQRGK